MTAVLGRETVVNSRAIADYIDAVHHGPNVSLRGFNALDSAGADELAYCVYDEPERLMESNAGVVVCRSHLVGTANRTLLVADNPKLGFIRAVDEFFQERPPEAVIHETAVIHPDAAIGQDVRIGANAVVGDGVTIGDRCVLRPCVVLGSPGFGYERDSAGQLHRQYHAGGVRIEDDVEIGPNSRIDRAVFGDTVIGRGSKLSGGVHVAHGVRIGPHTTVAYNAGFAGGVTVGARVTVHPHASVATDVTIGDEAVIGMNAAVLEDVPPNTTVVGSPARPIQPKVE